MEKPRIIFLNGTINEGTALSAIIQLLDFDRQNNKEIQIYINSPGGSILHGLAIYDTIQLIQSPVSTVCYGMAASMGAFLLTCGQKGKRYALPNSRILIHQPLISSEQGMYSTQSSITRLANNLQRSRTQLETIMAKNIGKDIEIIHRDCERDYWMSATEALEYGIIDGIVQEKIASK